MSEQVEVVNMPACDLCQQVGRYVEASYDAKLCTGPWAYVCEDHFTRLGVGLGTGRGQRLVLKEA